MRAVADASGLPISVVRDLLSDCPECGAEMSGRGSVCASCSAKQRRKWTREDMLVARDGWIAEHGKPPTSYNWAPTGGRPPKASPNRGSRWEPGEYPAYTTVQRVFGGWAAFLSADSPAASPPPTSD